MSGTPVNMHRAELWARVTFGEDRALTDATIDDRPLTNEERVELLASTLVEVQAGHVLRLAIIEGLNVEIAATNLLGLLAPWWFDTATLDEVLGVVPASVLDEALCLLQIIAAVEAPWKRQRAA